MNGLFTMASSTLDYLTRTLWSRSPEEEEMEKLDCFLRRYIPSVKMARLEGFIMKASQRMNLRYFTAMMEIKLYSIVQLEEEGLRECIALFDLSAAIKKIEEEYRCDCFATLRQRSEQELQTVILHTFWCAAQDPSTRPMQYLFLSDQEILSLPWSELEEFSTEHSQLLAMRMDKALESFSPQSLEEGGIVSLRYLQGRDLQERMVHFNEATLLLLSPQQLCSLDFDQLTESQADCLLKICREGPLELKFRPHFSRQNIQNIIFRSSSERFGLLPDEWYPYVTLSLLSKEKIDRYFSAISDRMRAREMIQRHSPQEINQHLEKLTAGHMELLTRNQLRELKTAKLAQEQLQGLLPFFRLHPGYDFKIESKKEFGVFYTYEKIEKTNSTTYRYTTSEWEKERSALLIKNIKALRQLDRPQFEAIADQLTLRHRRLFDELHAKK